jgi:hypothetical protein
MLTRRTAALLSLLLVIAQSASAQKQVPPATVVDTIDIVSAKPGTETRVLLVNTGTRVNVVSPNYPVSAETLSVMTPIRLVLPLERFSLAVTSAPLPDGAETSVKRQMEKEPGKGKFESTFYSPFTFARDSAGAALTVHASRLMSKRIP